MNWTALVPVKAVASRKSRLAPHLSPADRAALSEAMLARVIAKLYDCHLIARILLLTPCPAGKTGFVHDGGRGLNVELTDARQGIGDAPLLVIHADLPLLRTQEVDALLAAATAHGQAIAPDRHSTGTNALAIADGVPLAWCFGSHSFAAHRAVLPPDHAVIELPGLSHDCDTIADLVIAEAHGFPRFGKSRRPLNDEAS